MLLGGGEGGPEGTVVCRGEMGFLHGGWGSQRLKIAEEGIEGLPERNAGTIGRAGFGEVGPIVLHGGGKLELLGVEGWAGHGDWEIEEILYFGGVGGGVLERDRRKEILRGVLVVELIGGERDELGHGEVRA